MPSYHIHIEGQVQGVGFRPFVYGLAKALALKGSVSNGVDGVHIDVAGSISLIQDFYKRILDCPPPNARITSHSLIETTNSHYGDFQIVESSMKGIPNLLLTPDLGLCKVCRSEILNPSNRRHHYSFTTCIHCGPRYSIINQLPYDRDNTTMRPFEPCELCSEEYHNPSDRRHFSQTNSCLECGIKLQLLDNQGKLISRNHDVILSLICAGLKHGKIIGLKGIGGYLLLADATHVQPILTLRRRKARPSKPFALLYPDLERIKADAEVSMEEEASLQSIEAPIVLLKVKKNTTHEICLSQLAPGLNSIGVMLPYTPLLALLMDKWNKPVIATSGNISGSPIFYEDPKAIESLASIADFFVVNNRDIVVPQDDSVIQFTEQAHQRIVLRRSRGLAPTFLPHTLGNGSETLLAMGSDLKSSFALLNNGNLYVSQYLGDLEDFETQESYNHTMDHLLKLLDLTPDRIIIDQHPGYFASAVGTKLADRLDVPVKAVQHHLAHFSAVLAENKLEHTKTPVLGVIWDGTGWGEDGAIWGGEFFTYEHHQFNRVGHLDYFDHLLGDKISREPRLSALSLCKNIPEAEAILRPKFSTAEWDLYSKMLTQTGLLQTSSMGRFFDGMASLLGLCDKSSYEGEAAMYLEALASKASELSMFPRARWCAGKALSLQSFMELLIDDILHGTPHEIIAYNIHVGLVNWIANIATREEVVKVAFSGGVFQNSLLVDLIQKVLGDKYELYFHKQLSPNDECIGFGQMAYDHIQQYLSKSTGKQLLQGELMPI